jgi:quinol monooxygenase YgiN
MSQPIVFISHSQIKEGAVAALREMVVNMYPTLEQSLPLTVAHLAYFNEEQTEVTFIHVFPDAAAMEAHMEGAAARANTAYEYIETLGFEVYGPASEAGLRGLLKAAAADVPLIVVPDAIGGYLRLHSA